MIISWKYKFLFVHIPKTGGTALSKALTPYARPYERAARIALETPLLRQSAAIAAGKSDPVKFLTGIATHALIQTAETHFGPDKIFPLTKFLFVRNPFTHAYSLYAHVLRNHRHALHATTKTSGFSGFLKHHYLKGYGAQLPFVRTGASKACKLDFIGRFERFHEDVEALERRLNLPAIISIPQTNKNPSPPNDLRMEFDGMLNEFIDAKQSEFEFLGYSPNIDHAIEPPGSNAALPIRAAAQWGDGTR